ncbi:hypothetical protein CC2G_013005 [Coprinopsis cinerea AmutBmut pab1-1]|nr:hypothetical protein CC2G_013005 [Coprinopsis cinerea AmutBmut pab1-1]
MKCAMSLCEPHSASVKKQRSGLPLHGASISEISFVGDPGLHRLPTVPCALSFCFSRAMDGLDCGLEYFVDDILLFDYKILHLSSLQGAEYNNKRDLPLGAAT